MHVIKICNILSFINGAPIVPLAFDDIHVSISWMLSPFFCCCCWCRSVIQLMCKRLWWKGKGLTSNRVNQKIKNIVRWISTKFSFLENQMDFSGIFFHHDDLNMIELPLNGRTHSAYTSKIGSKRFGRARLRVLLCPIRDLLIALLFVAGRALDFGFSSRS